MLRYYVWALGEKVLGLAPGGKIVYQTVGRVVKRKSQGCGGKFITSLPVVTRVSELAPPGAIIMDVGTGWFHNTAFLLYLAGRGGYKILLFDVEDKALLHYIKNYLTDLHQHSSLLANELGIKEKEIKTRLEELLCLPSREKIYDRCNFKLCISKKTDVPFVPQNSVDVMVSNCTLVHIPPRILLPELRNLRDILKDDGFMYHMLGHDDHWAFHDPSILWPSFNYLRYSDRMWSLFFETNLEYHNRLVRPEWLDIFYQCGLRVLEYSVLIDDRSRNAVTALPSIHQRFAHYDLDDLAIVYSYILLQKVKSDQGPAVVTEPMRTGTITLPSCE